MKNMYRGRRGGVFVLLALIMGFNISAVLADNIEYGSIKITIPPAPFKTNTDPTSGNLPSNYKFFTSGSPNPASVGELDTTSIRPNGTIDNALYTVYNTTIVKGKTITVLAINEGAVPNLYARTNQATNQTSNLQDTMTFPGGAPKAFILDNKYFTKWYKNEAPKGPANFNVVLEGYSALDFRPIIKVDGIAINDPDHEVTAYKEEIFLKGDANLLDNGAVSGVWRPDPAKLYKADAERTYTVKVYAGNHVGFGPALAKDVLVPSPGGGGPVNQLWHFKKSVNPFAYPFDTTKTVRKIDSNGVELGSNGVIKVRELIAAINAQSSVITNVGVFGWFDPETQKHFGLTSIAEAAYNQDGTINAANEGSIPVTGPLTATQILDTPLKNLSQPYQVSVRNAVDFALNGTLNSNTK